MQNYDFEPRLFYPFKTFFFFNKERIIEEEKHQIDVMPLFVAIGSGLWMKYEILMK